MAALKSKIVRVSVRGNRLTVSPLRVMVRDKGWQVLWKCTGGRLTVKFKKGTGSFPASPFAPGGFKGSAKASLGSGEVVPKAQKKKHTYSYTLKIQPTQSGIAPITVDPQIDVTDSGGGPGGGRGKSSRGPH